MEENVVVIREPKTFSFNLNWPENVDENLKHEMEFIMKNNESSADIKIKSEIEQFLSKYKLVNDIHEQTNQWNKSTT